MPFFKAGRLIDRPFIVDDGDCRRLQFSAYDLQSQMSLAEPHALQIAYTQVMMTFLLFQPYPRHIVIVGLGGGSLTKFCHQHLRTARITTVEVSREVIRLVPWFHIPAEDTRMRIVHANAVEYFATTREWADVVLLDGCDEMGTAQEFRSEAFYHSVRQRLRPGGLLVANLCGTRGMMDTHEQLIAQTFEKRTVTLPVLIDTNRIAFGFNAPFRQPDWRSFNSDAEQLARHYKLDFPGFAKGFQRRYQKNAGRHA